MKNDEILDGFGMISDKFIAQAHEDPRHMNGKKAVALALVLSLIFILAVPVFATAADDETAYNLVYSFLPEVAQKLKPVRMTCEDNGIKLEVVSANVEGCEAQVLFKLTGEQIDGTVDPFDSEKINTAFDSWGTCSFVSYDENEHSALLLASMGTMNKENIKSGKVTFSMSRLLCGKEENIYKIDTDLKSLFTEKEMKAVKDEYSFDTVGENVENMVCADETGMIFDSGKGASIVSACYYNGKLHIKTRYDDISHTDNHGGVYFENADGDNGIICKDSIVYDDAERNCRYYEYLCDISPEQLDGYTLVFETTTCDTLVEGNWRVTFPVE